MSDIDLTEAVDMAAREAYASACVEGADATHESAYAEWDAGRVPPIHMHTIRTIVLPIVTAAHRGIARQAWEQCADWTQDEEREAWTEEDIRSANPYRDA